MARGTFIIRPNLSVKPVRAPAPVSHKARVSLLARHALQVVARRVVARG